MRQTGGTMKLGLLSAILGEMPFEKMVDFAGELKLECVEVACWPVAERSAATQGSAISMWNTLRRTGPGIFWSTAKSEGCDIGAGILSQYIGTGT